jgi:hypothetical protein
VARLPSPHEAMDVKATGTLSGWSGSEGRGTISLHNSRAPILDWIVTREQLGAIHVRPVLGMRFRFDLVVGPGQRTVANLELIE